MRASEIATVALAYVEARNNRNKAKAHRASFVCEVQQDAEQDETGWTFRGSPPCYIRLDEWGMCEACTKREPAHQAYLFAAREMGSAWGKLKRRADKVKEEREDSSSLQQCSPE